MNRVVAIAALLACSAAAANDDRAQFNYIIHCQGCHLPDAMGFQDTVPRMNNFLGYFLHSQDGREFVIQVPGVSTARLPDDEIAELMNWLINTYSAGQRPENFVPYTQSEVRELRRSPDADPLRTRTRILRAIAAEEPALANKLITGYNE